MHILEIDKQRCLEPPNCFHRVCSQRSDRSQTADAVLDYNGVVAIAKALPVVLSKWFGTSACFECGGVVGTVRGNMINL